MKERIKRLGTVLDDYFSEHFALLGAIFFLFIALILYLGFNVDERFVTYPIIGIGCIAIIIAFIILGFMAIVWIPFVAVPALIPVWLIGELMEAFPKVTVGLFAAIGLIFLGYDIVVHIFRK